MDVTIFVLALAVGVAVGWLLAAGRGRWGHSLRDVVGGEAADALERVQRQLVELDRGRVGSDAALREQVRAMQQTSSELRAETANLVTALRTPHVRGRWGEVQLERLVEAAGLTEHVDYETQASAAGEGGTLRPDLLVRLAGGKHLVVDAKAPLAAYLEAVEAPDERARDERLVAHARHLRAHVDALSAKAYWRRFTPTPEFVVCFVPADAVLDAALRADPTLLEHAFARDVVLAAPSTLVALLRTVAYTWRQESLAQNAAEIHQLGRQLYERIATLGGHVDAVGRSLSRAVSSYNSAVGSLEHRVVPTARRMAELGVVPPGTDPVTARPLHDALVRPLTAGEFAAGLGGEDADDAEHAEDADKVRSTATDDAGGDPDGASQVYTDGRVYRFGAP